MFMQAILTVGQIAVAPCDLYFAGSPPDEKIFHELAQLRISLSSARNIQTDGPGREAKCRTQ